MMEYEGKNLQPISTLPRVKTKKQTNEYAKVMARMVHGTMTKYVIDNTVYYDVAELENFIPKKAGRKPKLQVYERSSYNTYIVLNNVFTDHIGIVRTQNEQGEKVLFIGERNETNCYGEFNSEWDEVCWIIDTGLTISEKVLKKIL